jgi:hypothetical protein
MRPPEGTRVVGAASYVVARAVRKKRRPMTAATGPRCDTPNRPTRWFISRPPAAIRRTNTSEVATAGNSALTTAVC